MVSFTIPTDAVHQYGLVCITDTRFLSPELRATLEATAERIPQERSMEHPERLAPWEISLKVRNPPFDVGDRVVRRDDETTTGIVEIAGLADARVPWPGAIGVRRMARHGKEVLEWWRTQSTDFA